MSGQHGENYDVKRETVHCYPRNVIAAIARDPWNLSADFKFCFLRFWGNKIHCSPQHQSLSFKYSTLEF